MKLRDTASFGIAIAAAMCAGSISPALAEGAKDPTPAIVTAAVREIERTCQEVGGKPITTGVVTAADLTADGVVDYLVDLAGADCDGAASIYGDRDKGVWVYVGDGRGGAAMAHTESVYGARLEGTGRAARLWLTVAGADCGKPPAPDFASENFCERPLAWNAKTRKFALGPVGGPSAANAASAQPVDPCGGSPRCFAAGTFVVEIVGVTPSAMTPGAKYHTVALDVRFRNVSDQPVILGYRKSSSSGTDNFGNGFAWGRPGTHDTSAKGIGYVDGRSADLQFSLAPGQSRNASFGLIRFNPVPPIGTAFGWNVVIDELELLPGQQIRSIRQNSVSFRNLAPGTYAATAAGATSAGAAPASGAAAATQAIEAAGKLIDLFKKK